MKTIVSKSWPLLVNYFTIAFFCFYLFSCVHLIIEQLTNNTWLSYSLSIIFAVALLLFFCRFHFIRARIDSVRIIKSFNVFSNSIIEKCCSSNLKSIIVLCFITFIIRIVILCVFRTPILGDPAVYVDISKEFVSNGIICRNADYSSNFPHLFWFGLFLVPAAIFSSLGDWVFQVYICVVLSFNAFLVYEIAKNICTTSSKAFKIAIIYSYLPSQLFCGLTISHEFAYTSFLLLAILVWCKRKSIVTWIVVCLLLSLARLINNSGVVALIALLLCLLLVRNSFGGFKSRILALVFLALISFCVSLGSTELQKNMTDGNVVLRRSSIEWQLFIGGNVETEGRWSESDIEIINNVVENSENEAELKASLRCLVSNRWLGLMKSPVNLFSHLLNKFCNVWSGTHYSLELVSVYIHDKIGKSFMLMLIGLNNLLYLLLITKSISGMWKRRNSIESDIIIYMKTTVIGTACMLLLTETMNKYSLTVLGLIIILIGFYIGTRNDAAAFV